MTEEVRTARRFRASRPAFDRTRAARQSEVTRVAVELLGGDAAMLFLNQAHEGAGVRPLDRAGESDAAKAEVLHWLDAMRRPGDGRQDG